MAKARSRDVDAGDALERAAKRAYEAGRLRWAMRRAAALTAVVGIVSVVAFGGAVVPYLPLPFVVYTAAAVRGGALLAGMSRGALAGLGSLLLPLSLLRPCCAAGAAGASCCAAPSVCSVFGALLGGSFALLLPRVTGWRRVEAAAGLFLGVAAVGALRCEAMLVGELAGLLLGAATGLAALGVVRAAVDRVSD